MTQTKLNKVQNVSSGVSANVLDSFSIAWVSGVSGEKGKDGSVKEREEGVILRLLSVRIPYIWNSMFLRVIQLNLELKY